MAGRRLELAWLCGREGSNERAAALELQPYNDNEIFPLRLGGPKARPLTPLPSLPLPCALRSAPQAPAA